MKGDSQVIAHLNKILGNELIAINQYFLHSRLYRHWGINKLADKEYAESIDEMKHADVLIQRILFLGGIPNLQKLGQLLIGEHPEEMLASDLKLEEIAKANLQEAISYCEQIRDYVSRDLCLTILNSEEEHIDWLETQIELIEKIGIQHYLQSHL